MIRRRRTIRSHQPANSPPRPLVVEVSGPAGSGKSTLGQLLCRRDPQLLEMPFPTRLQCLWELPRLATGGRLRHGQRGLARDALRAQLYLQAWLKSLPRLDGDRLFDQGPVFRLAMLDNLGSAAPQQEGWLSWRRSLLEAWSHELSLVVWLDAPNDVLLRRIRDRHKEHRCKELADRDAHGFLDTHRQAHQAVLTAMLGLGNPRILPLRADRHIPEEIAELVSRELASIRQNLASS